MRLHLLGIPHTVTTPEFSHCAFTGKVLRFAPMLRSVGYEVVHYGISGAQSGANEQVDVMSRDEQETLIGKHVPGGRAFAGDHADVGSALYVEFNRRLRTLLLDRVQPRDAVCLPFGHAHQACLTESDVERRAFVVETGIGYPTTCARFRIFESEAWYHWHLGRDQRPGDDYNWVIPNYYDSREWQIADGPGEYLLYFGRICDAKGLAIVVEIARHRPDLRVVLCGQGNPTPYLVARNIEYHPPIAGVARSDLLRRASSVLMPTRYVEPFGGVAVEAQLCGVPVLGSAFGAFTETIIHGTTGFRCRTLGDWLAGVERAAELDRTSIRRLAVERFDLTQVGPLYRAAFTQMDDLMGEGWYRLRSEIGHIRRVTPPTAVSAIST